MKVYSHSTRAFLCAGCGIPLSAPVSDGTVACSACQANTELKPRSDERLGSSEQTDEAERIRRLRTQDGKPLLPPTAIANLFGPGGGIPEWKLTEAQAVWKSSRKAVEESGDYGQAEQLLYLTLALANHFSDPTQEAHRRALLESALDAFTLPRHQQMMRGYLSRGATMERDLSSAEAWLAPCDPLSDDLSADSAYRISRAMIDSRKGDYDAVLRILGEGADEVPIMDAMDPMAVLHRAHALEKMGDVDRAVEQLSAYMSTGGASGRQALEKIRGVFSDWDLCPLSFERGRGQHAEVASQAASSRASGGLGGLYGCGCMMLLSAVGCLVLGGVLWAMGLVSTDSSTSVLIPMGFSLLIPGFILTALGRGMRRAAKRAAYLTRHGERAQGTVTQIAFTGTTINGVKQYKITLEVQLEGRDPVLSTTRLLLQPPQAAQLQPGVMLAVLVDPKNPSEVIIDT